MPRPSTVVWLIHGVCGGAPPVKQRTPSLALALINYPLSPRPPMPPSRQCPPPPSRQACLSSSSTQSCLPTPPCAGPFPSLSLPLFLTSPRRGQSARQGLRPPFPFSDGPAFINADIQPRRHISLSNVLPTGGSSLNTLLSTIVSTRHPAYIAKSRSSAQIRSQSQVHCLSVSLSLGLILL